MAGVGLPGRGRQRRGLHEAFPAWGRVIFDAPGAGRDAPPGSRASTRTASRHPGGVVTGQAAEPAGPATAHTVIHQLGGTMPVTLAQVLDSGALIFQGREQEHERIKDSGPAVAPAGAQSGCGGVRAGGQCRGSSRHGGRRQCDRVTRVRQC